MFSSSECAHIKSVLVEANEAQLKQFALSIGLKKINPEKSTEIHSFLIQKFLAGCRSK